jgi:integrase
VFTRAVRSRLFESVLAYPRCLYKKCIMFLVSFNGAEFPMPNQRRNASPPNTVNCTVRKYLTTREIEKLMDYARKRSRYGHRDSTMILVAYRHGLRASEVCDLQWHQIELDHGRMHVRRAKNGTPSVHPIRGDEIRALRKLRRESPNEAFVFVTERGGPIEHRRLPPSHPAARRGRQDAFPVASSHAAACVRLQACQRWA